MNVINQYNNSTQIRYMCSFFGMFFNNFNYIVFEENKINMYNGDMLVDSINLLDATNFASHVNGIFNSTLKIAINFQEINIRWLKKYDENFFCNYINNFIQKNISTKIKYISRKLKEKIFVFYPRDTWFDEIKEYIRQISSFEKIIEDNSVYFCNEDKIDVKNLSKFINFSIGDFQRIHEEYQLQNRKQFFDRVERYPLTDKQCLGVIRSNDRNMVLAAAGTGKTSVIVAKVLDLIDRNLCRPDEILVIAYNKSAAVELNERIHEKSKTNKIDLHQEPYISTFHALGRKILQMSEIRPTLSVFANDDVELMKWITEWLKNYIHSSLFNFLNALAFSIEPIDEHEINSAKEYQGMLRDNAFKTLKNEEVKGYEELEIANFLALNNIDYAYEKPYLSKRRLEDNIDYKPDFTILDTNIYMEHFGIDRNGQTRPDIDAKKYNEIIIKKRNLHKQFGTILIETYHYEWKEKILFDNLTKKLQEHGVKLTPITKEQVEEMMKNNKISISNWSQMLYSCLKAIRVENLDQQSIKDRLKNANISLAGKKADFLIEFVEAYKKQLLNEGTIDFDDMIIRSKDVIENKRFIPHWKYILVDEFQDISNARMDLIKALIKYGPQPSLTVVGDDWQAIYRFSGGKLELTTRFESLVGHCSFTQLDKTFRYNSSIADVSEKFIMQNPEQIVKHIQTHTIVNSPQIILLDDIVAGATNLNAKIYETINRVRESNKTASISIIARYNYILNNFRDEYKYAIDDNISLWTFHKSKGLEADFVILAGFEQGKTGFPCENRDTAIVEALLPSVDGFPHSEERRLMYVGMTRAKNQVFIIANPKAPSQFISELTSAWYNIQIESKYFTKNYRDLFKCPYCVDGYLKLMIGKYGKFYACSTGKGCPVGKARVCEKCGAPSVDNVTESRCTNPKCGYSFPICEKCGRPMRVRHGRYGDFLGCSGYGIKEDQCTNTRNIN